jgi:hypothetical protein
MLPYIYGLQFLKGFDVVISRCGWRTQKQEEKAI